MAFKGNFRGSNTNPASFCDASQSGKKIKDTLAVVKRTQKNGQRAEEKEEEKQVFIYHLFIYSSFITIVSLLAREHRFFKYL